MTTEYIKKTSIVEIGDQQTVTTWIIIGETSQAMYVTLRCIYVTIVAVRKIQVLN